ncbi:unnamed protein product [Macrosiphum euphorbiae]|uniref:Uncharacterized protein n=1 Tax=Macrosiphum euphorbiae TaxID=13131 RepID=A0AAV0W830_9HEMI|nr:unnamed protein product [Macrosiphum euphorbiae]
MSNDGSGCSELRQVSVKDLIPESRLAVVAGDFFVSDPVVYDGDDVFEVNLTPDDRAGRQARLRFSDTETWMLPDTEYMFLRCIAGADANDVEHFIAEKSHWLGGKNISLNLDVSKTIFNRQTKLVLHNTTKPLQKTLDYYITNASQPLKKTNFILEDWPYVSLNKPLIPKGTDDELAPWMRSRNKKFNTCLPVKSNKTPQSALSTHDYDFLHGYWKLQQTQQQKQHQRPHQLYQQQQQHLHKVYQQQRQQHQYQQQLQHRQRQQHLQHNLQQRAIFFPPLPSRQQVFMYGQQPMIGPYLSNIAFQGWPGNFYQRFSTPFLLATHYQLDPNNNDLSSAATTQH